LNGVNLKEFKTLAKVSGANRLNMLSPCLVSNGTTLWKI
jgi:hypothetical protein